MSDYKVTDSELTGIANAIRTKGGTSSPLVFPNGFTSAIGAIPTGGGAKNILGGTSNPSNSEGYDGDIYLKYSDYSGDTISGYTKVEYIGVGTTGGPRINTLFNFTTKSEFEIEAQYTDVPNNNSWLFGNYSNGHQTDLGYTGGNIWIQTGGANRSMNFDTQVHVYKSTQESFIQDNTVLTGAVPNWGNTTTGQAYLFHINDGSASNNCRVYYCKIWDDGVLVRDLVPVYRNIDSAIGMYDLVNDVFYENIGTGSFVAGQEVSGTPIDTAYLKVDGSWILLENGNWDDVNTGS